MDRQRHVVIVSENPYYRAVFRETLVEAGFVVDDQVSAEGLANHLRRTPGTSLLLVDNDLSSASSSELLLQLNDSNTAPPHLRAVCLVGRPPDSTAMQQIRSAGFDGVIPIDATPELILFRVNDLIFAEEAKQRKNLRAPVAIDAEVLSGKEQTRGIIISLSKHGLFLKSEKLRPAGSTLELTFTLPEDGCGAGRRLTVPGRVNLVKEFEGAEDIYFGPGMVVIFESPNASIMDLIDDFVAGELDKIAD